MHTNATTVRMQRPTRTRQTTHHRPTTKGNLRASHAKAQAAIAARFVQEG
jgi:hypothetical protein